MLLGNKIKELRLQCSLTQEELADRCELTKGYISQLENDLTSPSIATLIDILSILGSSLKEFFDEEEEQKIVYKKKDFVEKNSLEMKLKWLVSNAQKNLMEPIIVEINGNSYTQEDIPHEGEEFGFILEGSVVVFYGKKKYICKKGESFYFKSDKIHYIFNKDNTKAKLIWVSSPPNF
jgi:transcriptional regulator with XRE-family HTH domain